MTIEDNRFELDKLYFLAQIANNLMMNDSNSNEPPVLRDYNPYGVSSAMESMQIKTIPAAYWIILSVLMLLSIGVAVLFLPLGCLGIGAVFFGFLRSLGYTRCIRNGLMYARAEELQTDYMPFLLANLAIGLLATIASGIAFVATCFPLGIGVFTLGASFGAESMSVLAIGLILVCGILGIVAGWLIVRLTLPKIQTPPNLPPVIEHLSPLEKPNERP